MYPTGLAALLGSLDLTAATVKMQLLEGYAYSSAHDFLDDVASGVRVGSPVTLIGKTVTAGAFHATVPTFTSVATGHTVDGLLLYESTGVEATSRLVALINRYAAGGVPLAIVTDGDDITLDWGTSPIFTI